MKPNKDELQEYETDDTISIAKLIGDIKHQITTSA